MKVTIVNISKKERVSSKTGKPFVSLGLKTEEHGEKWLSGFANKDNANWKVGDTVEIDIEQKGEYLNFTTPKARHDNTELLNKIQTIKMQVNEIHEVMPLILKALKIEKRQVNAMGVDSPDYVEPNFAPEDSEEIPF